jgi:hypothetical protein
MERTIIRYSNAVFNGLYIIIVLVSLSLAILSIILAVKVDQLYYGGLLLILPLAFVGYKIRMKLKLDQLKAQLRQEWGVEQNRDRDFDAIRKYYDCTAAESNQRSSYLDDQTWSDLNMPDVYARIDRTFTNPGESVLYSFLRKPLMSDDILKKRMEILRLMHSDDSLREYIQMGLCRLGRQKYNGLVSLLWTDPMSPTSFKYLFSFLALLALASIFAAIISGGFKVVLLIIAPLFLTNIIITHLMRDRLLPQLGIIRYLGGLIRLGNTFSNIEILNSKYWGDGLKKAASACAKIASKTFFLQPERAFSADLDIIYEYINIYFLSEVRIYFSVLDEIRSHREDLKLIYQLLGELDAMQSVASWRQGLPSYVEPDFSEKNSLLDLRHAIHPLLEDPVPNSIIIRRKGVIITGSNMSGKTTFLRTVGINVILAQTIGTCLAIKYSGSFFRIISSINDADDLMSGKSYYLAEAERLLVMIKSSEQNVLTLCLIDEPLAGTNSLERGIASSEILRYLVDHQAVVLASTHDIGLAEQLASCYDRYHFTDEVGSQGLRFDFRLKLGVATTSNAIKLLSYLGYPQSVIDRALTRRGNTLVNPCEIL